ncbi:hypothetical protein MHB63_18645 [Bacillus sp. FSL H8-0547]
MVVLKWLFHGFFFAMFILLAYFGGGSVLFADGETGERVVTAFFVIMTAAFLGMVYHSLCRHFFK